MEAIRVLITYEFASQQEASDFKHKVIGGMAKTLAESGCQQVDVCQGELNPTHIFLLEVWQSRLAFDKHWAAKLESQPNWKATETATYEFYVQGKFAHGANVWQSVDSDKRCKSIHF